MNTRGPTEATQSFSVISPRQLGGAPDLRAPCVFGQRLNGYHPFEGSIAVVYFALALVQALRWGRILRPTSESASLL
jgi:hypothetical protein